MTADMAWGYINIDDMIAIGQDRVRQINGLLMRDGAVASAKAAALIRDTLAAHPAIAAAIDARRSAAVAAVAAQPVADGVVRALNLAD